MPRTRHAWFVLLFPLFAPSLCAAEPPASPAQDTWRKGQQAMLEGRTEEAVAAFRHSLEQDPSLVQNRLSLAAAHLALGQEEQAAEQLGLYLKARPEHVAVRGQYAELLLRLERLGEARAQFERFDADLQENEALGRQHLVHCHSRLLDLAAEADDDYGRHLHRGIALYWLARRRAEIDDDGDEMPAEALLCEAAGELLRARRLRPDEARPCWYLYEVWSRLGRRQPAARWLRAAEDAAPFSPLTPAEQRRLHFACRARGDDGARK